jgi:hypothetical protein
MPTRALIAATREEKKTPSHPDASNQATGLSQFGPFLGCGKFLVIVVASSVVMQKNQNQTED